MQGSFVNKRGTTWTAYYYVADANGRRRQRSKGGFATKKAAQAHLNTVLGNLETGQYVEPAKLTLADYLEQRWLPTIEPTIRPSTFDSYRRMLRLHVNPRLGGIPLQSLSTDHLDRLYAELLKTPRASGGDATLSPKTVRYIHTTLHKALKDAERKRLVYRNVASAADPPRNRQSGSQEMKTWTVEELRLFLDTTASHRLGTAYLLAATTGMRRGEVLGLRWRDVDLEARRLAVRQTIVSVNYRTTIGTPKTARGRRSLALDEATVAALRSHRARQAEERRLVADGYTDNDLVFAKVDGSPVHPDYFSQLFERTVLALPVTRIRLHDLRHTHATLGLEAGIPPKIISDRLGHATVAFTQDVYMHAIPRLEMDAADTLAAIIFKPLPTDDSKTFGAPSAHKAARLEAG